MLRFLLFSYLYLYISIVLEASEIQFPYPSPKDFNLEASTSIKSVYEALRMNDLPASRQRLTHIRQTSAELQEQSLANFYLCLLHLNLDQVDRAKRYLEALKRAAINEAVKNRAQALYDVHVAWYYLKKRQWNRAKNLFVSSLQLDNDLTLKNYISRIYLHRTRFMQRGRDLRWKASLLKQSLDLNPENISSLATYVSVLERQNRQTEAIPYLHTLVRLDPKPSLRLKLADWLTKKDEASEAFQLFKALHLEFPENKEYMNQFIKLGKALQLNSDEEVQTPTSIMNTEPNRLDKVSQLMAENKLDEAKNILEKRIHEEPSEWDSVEKMVRVMLSQKKAQDAHELLKAKTQFNSLPRYTMTLANVLERTDPVECEMFILSLDLEKNFSPMQIIKLRETLGKAYLKQSRLQKAQEVFEDLLDPKWSKLNRKDVAHFYLGVFYGQLKYFQKSLYHYRTADDIRPDNPKYLLALATSMRQLGLLEESTKLVSRLLRNFPKSKYSGYARKLFQIPKPKTTDIPPKIDLNLPPYMATFTWLRDHDPINFTPIEFELLLDKLEVTRQWDRLIETLERSLDERYNSAHQERLDKIYENYSKLNYKYVLNASAYSSSLRDWFTSGDSKTILAFLNHLHPAVEIVPSLQMQFAKYFENLKDYERALPMYRRLNLETLEPPLSQSEVLASMGYCNYMLRHLDEALENYYQALNLDPNNVNLLFQLAELLQANGDLQKARLVYQEIQALNQNDQSVRDASFYLRQLQKKPSKQSQNKQKG